MKSFKSVIGYVLIFAIMLNITSIFANNINYGNSYSNKDTSFNLEYKIKYLYGEDFFYNHDYALYTHQNLMSSFYNNVDFVSIDYPNYYGGSYINDDGNLVVFVYGEMETYAKYIFNKSGSSNMVLEEATYSLNTLLDVINTINEYIIKSDNYIQDNINSILLKESENRVIVYLNERTQESIEDFKLNVTDSSAVVFKQSKGKINNSLTLGATNEDEALNENNLDVNLHAGHGVYVRKGTTGFIDEATVSYRAMLGGVVPGVVTIGHSIDKGDTLFFNGVPFAIVRQSIVGGSVDASFAELITPNPGFQNINLTNTINHGFYTLSTQVINPPERSLVLHVGGQSGASTGEIISTNASTTGSDGIWLTNLSVANYRAIPGDSGGIVTTAIGETRPTVGITKSLDQNTGEVYFVKANLANQALGVVRY